MSVFLEVKSPKSAHERIRRVHLDLEGQLAKQPGPPPAPRADRGYPVLTARFAIAFSLGKLSKHLGAIRSRPRPVPCLMVHTDSWTPGAPRTGRSVTCKRMLVRGASRIGTGNGPK